MNINLDEGGQEVVNSLPHLSREHVRCSPGWWPDFHLGIDLCLPALPSNGQIWSVIYVNRLAGAHGSEAICCETTALQLQDKTLLSVFFNKTSGYDTQHLLIINHH